MWIYWTLILPTPIYPILPIFLFLLILSIFFSGGFVLVFNYQFLLRMGIGFFHFYLIFTSFTTPILCVYLTTWFDDVLDLQQLRNSLLKFLFVCVIDEIMGWIFIRFTFWELKYSGDKDYLKDLFTSAFWVVVW